MQPASNADLHSFINSYTFADYIYLYNYSSIKNISNRWVLKLS